MNKIGKFRRAICGPRFFSAAVNNVGQLVIRIMKVLFNAGSNVGAVLCPVAVSWIYFPMAWETAFYEP
jgi:hypothetical protein